MDGVIFDFDGVIVDTERQKFLLVQELLHAEGLVLGQELFPLFAGKKTARFLQEQFPDLASSIRDKIVEKRRELFASLQFPLIRGIRALLIYLQEQGMRIGLATGSTRPFVEGVLKKHGLEGFFDALTTGECYSESKGHPECILLTKERLGSSDPLVIEDSLAGIEAARAAGAKVVALTTYLEKEQLSDADEIFCDHEEILAAFRTGRFAF